MRNGGVRVVLAVIGLGVLVALAAPADAAGPDIAVTSTIDGHSLKDAGANSPIALRPTDSTVVRVEVRNNGSTPVDVRSVRLDARVLGLAFFSYTTRVDLTVAPGQSGTRTFALDLGDLDGQATGLLPGELSLLAPDRTVVAGEKGTVDVKGQILSVYGVFGLAIAAITGLLLLGLLVRLVRRTLPDNRWTRALRFAVPGLGLGMTVTFTLGVVRVLVPSLVTSIALLAGGVVVGFALGYLTPSPKDEADRDELDERDILTQEPPAPPSVRVYQPEPPAVPTPEPIVAVGTPEPPAASETPELAEVPAQDDPRQTRIVGRPKPPPA